MSKSFMSAIRGVVNAINEGAKDKTADGMTKDAAHFRKDLHTIQDSGMKHLVQKDSETKDYEKMFSGDVDKAPANRSSYAPGEDLNKYVEYNEHVEIEEAKKHDKDCECEDCAAEEDDKEEVKEAAPLPAGAQTSWQTKAKPSPTGQAIQSTSRGSSSSQVKPSGMSGNYPRSAQTTTTMAQQTKSTNSMAASRIKSAAKPTISAREPDAKKGSTSGPGGIMKPFQQTRQDNYADSMNRKVRVDTAKKTGGKLTGREDKWAAAINDPNRQKSANFPAGGARPGTVGTNNSNVKVVPTSKTEIIPPKPTPKPQGGAAPAKKPAAPAAAKPAAPAAAKPAAPKPQLNRQQKRQIERGVAAPGAKGGFGGVTTTQKAAPAKKAPVGTNPLKSHFEIDVNGTSYLVSEAHASAIAAFVEKYGMVNEGTAGDFIKKEMEHPEKLTAKGKKQKIKQALAIYYSKKRRGENP